MKYIFFTGGVVSSLGKGLAAAALGALLEHRGLSVVLQKFDPYLNVDPGTMSPYQHGEVYVLNDGAETDLDLGHYERFTSCVLTRLNNLTSGQVYESVIRKERAGDYNGKTVQVIPHVTDEIKNRIHEVAAKMGGDVIITEIGGTVGDIEGLPFLEAMRQFALDVGPENVLFIHVTLIPYLRAARELKTKPTQQSVAKLREIGIQPQIIIARTEKKLDAELRDKIALFCNVPKNAVIEGRDVAGTIYEMPIRMHKEGLDSIVCQKLGFVTPEPSLTDWERFVDRVNSPNREVKVAVVGKYISLRDAYKSIYEALTHAGAEHNCRVLCSAVDSEDIERQGAEVYLSGMDGVLIPGGFGDRGTEGKIEAAKYARENRIPYLGLCLGMQIATIEFARHVCGLHRANSTEFNKKTGHPVICLMEEQEKVEVMGASMRLGTYQTKLAPDSRAREIYGSDAITERHRHRYELNQKYRDQLEKAGLRISGTSPDNKLAEVIEISDHPFYIATQFHPEFLSKPNNPHPLFVSFIHAVSERHASNAVNGAQS